MVEMIYGIGGVKAYGDWVQLSIKPETVVSQKIGLKEVVDEFTSGKDNGMFGGLMHDVQEEQMIAMNPDSIRIPVDEYMSDHWNLSTRIRVKVDILKTWQPKKNKKPNEKLKWDERELD